MGNLTYELFMYAKQETIRKNKKKWVKIGEAIGEARGEEKCKAMQLDFYKKLKHNNLDDSVIMDCLHITPEQLKELQEKVDTETTSESTSEPLSQDS